MPASPALRAFCAALSLQLAAASLFGWGIRQGDASGEVAVPANISSANGVVKPGSQLGWGKTDMWCNVAFNPERRVFYAPYNTGHSGIQAILTIDAVTGTIVGNVSMSIGLPQGLATLVYDSGSGLIYGLPLDEGGSSDRVLAVDPATGNTTVVGYFPNGMIGESQMTISGVAVKEIRCVTRCL